MGVITKEFLSSDSAMLGCDPGLSEMIMYIKVVAPTFPETTLRGGLQSAWCIDD